MREIKPDEITETVYGLAMEAAFELPEDVLAALQNALQQETGPARTVLETLVENAQIAREQRIALCQDCGLVVIFARVGRDCHIAGDLYEAIDRGVAAAYSDGYLRKSVLEKPLQRDSNSGDNTPAVVHVELVAGENIELHLAPKGGGSENMSTVDMLVPAAGRDGVIEHIATHVAQAGGKPCPPLIVGIGLGGTMEKAALLSKWSLMRPLGEPSPDAQVARLEADILQAVNETGVGPMGLGGKTTALAVHVEEHPCHIASLPVAINLQCHSARHKHAVI
ncbi:MAG: fumarate hydratase [Armatimonadota bacterium]